MPRDVKAALTTRQPLEGEFSPVVRVGTFASRGISLHAFTPDDLNRLLHDVIVEEPGGDAKLAAAYLIGSVSWSLCEILTGLAMEGIWFTTADPNAIHLQQRFVKWQDEGETGVSLMLDVEIDETSCSFATRAAPDELAKGLVALHTSLVDALHAASGLGRAALWRLVADSLAAAFLEHGVAQSREAESIAFARRVLHDQKTKLSNKQTDFEWINLPEKPKIGRWMRLRGGCCRFYTAPNEEAEYCTTCVLRAADSRRQRFQAYIRSTLEDA